jgi:hypothetical protein
MIDHVGPIGRERQLEQRARKGIARLDQRKKAARGQVHALERAPDQPDDFANEPVRRVIMENAIDGDDRFGIADGANDHRADLRLVQSQPQQDVVELPKRAHRPRAVAGLHVVIARLRLR